MKGAHNEKTYYFGSFIGDGLGFSEPRNSRTGRGGGKLVDNTKNGDIIYMGARRVDNCQQYQNAEFGAGGYAGC